MPVKKVVSKKRGRWPKYYYAILIPILIPASAGIIAWRSLRKFQIEVDDDSDDEHYEPEMQNSGDCNFRHIFVSVLYSLQLQSVQLVRLFL